MAASGKIDMETMDGHKVQDAPLSVYGRRRTLVRYSLGKNDQFNNIKSPTVDPKNEISYQVQMKVNQLRVKCSSSVDSLEPAVNTVTVTLQ